MRSRLMLGAATIAAAMSLLHCASQEVLGVVQSVDAGSDANVADTGGDEDADAGVTDASIEDEYEVPDGAVVCDGSPCAVAITAATGEVSKQTICALMSDKTVQCWGSNLSSKAGVPDDLFVAAPRRVPGLTNIRSVSLGGENGCAVDEDGKVYCWGDPLLVNAGRDLDAGAPFDAPVPPTLMDLVPPSVSVGVTLSSGRTPSFQTTNTACATTKAGSLFCWGKNTSFELAGTTTESIAPPSEIPLGGRTDVTTSTGNRWMFAMTKGGELLSWGAYRCPFDENCSYMLGRESSDDFDPVPTVVPGMSNVRWITTGTAHACAVAGRYVECWGDNSTGQLGRGTSASMSELPGKTMLSAVTAADDADAGLSPRIDVPLQVGIGFSQTCAAMGSGRIYCWGSAPDDSDVSKQGTPRRVDGFSGPAVGVVVSGLTYCALLRNGAVECWGDNYLGSLGRNFDTLVGPSNEPPAPVVFANE